MRVALLTLYNPPEPNTKMHILAKGLIDRGHKASIITAFPNFPHGKIYPGYSQKLWMREEVDGVPVLRLPVYPDHSSSVLRRILNDLSFAASTTALAPFLVERGLDVIMVYSPPVTLGLSAWWLGLWRGAPFVFDVEDMWPDILVATKMLKDVRLIARVDALCRFVYKRAKAIIVITPGYRERLVSKGVPGNKISVIQNWAYEGTIPIEQPNDLLAKELGLHGRFNVIYAGIMGPAQGLQNVLAAARLLKDIPAVQIVLMGDGIEAEGLKRTAQSWQLTNVKFLGRRPMSDMPSIYALADCLLIHLTNDPHFSITIPGKTQSYLASGRPLVVCVAGDAADLVREAGAGLAVRPMDSADLARAIRELYAMPVRARDRFGLSGRDYYQKHLAPDVLIARYEKVLASCVGNSRSRTEVK